MSLAPTPLDPALGEPLPPRGAPCPACGSPVERGDHYCGACGQQALVDQPPVLAQTELAQNETAQRFFHCQNCGSRVATDPDQRSYTCAFCDSTYVVEFSPAESDRQRPEFVIGFAVPQQQAAMRFRHWLARRRWFQPADLGSARIVQRLRGVYMPFWSFPTLAESRWSAVIGEDWYRTEYYTTRVNGKRVRRSRRVRETEWWELAGGHHQYHEAYLVSAGAGLRQEEADRIMPFRLEGLKRYQPYFLAGWLAEEYALSRDAARQRCRETLQQREDQSIRDFLPGDRHRQLQVDTDFTHLDADLVLLPVYVLTYEYRGQRFRFLINGQTGQVAGDKPVARGRIAAAVAAGVVAVVLGVLLLWWLSRFFL